MKSRWIINLLLLLAIGILGLVVRYEPGIERPPEASAVTGLKQDEVRRIHVNRPIREDLILFKTEAERWTIEHTPALPADPLQIVALSKLAGQKAARSYPVSGLELSKLQLDPPYATVTLNGTPVEFGSMEPLEGLRYIRVADRVHLIPDLYMHLIETDYTQFVRRRLFDASAVITALKLPGFSLIKTDQGWAVEPQQEVSADTLQLLVDQWQNATALHIKSADSDERGEPVRVSFGDADQHIDFVITAREPELVLVRRDLGIQYRMGNLSPNLLSITTPASEGPSPDPS